MTARSPGVRRGVFASTLLGQLVVRYAPQTPATPSAAGRVDLVVHAAVFGVVAWTGRWAGVRTGPLLVLLALHAPLSEAVQYWLLPHRSGDLVDVLADLAGVGIGALLPVPGVAPRGG